ncbi:hypothetical protein COCNU_13G006670 [Cocos nucifera]|uniref:Uncharacterized protein n=1 Tax=Cocos nucifera TaxID=13894 RepID=A0A8K0ITD7_COCNU|nr:hypothetical protein COCNU_13G006670 [Cocos nucifera]
MRFDLYKAQVAWLFFGVDIDRLNLEESEDETNKDGAIVGATPSVAPRVDETEDGKKDIAPNSTALLEMNSKDKAKVSEAKANISSALDATLAAEPIITTDVLADH